MLLVAAQSYFELATRPPDALTRLSVGSNISSEELTISSLKPKLVGRYGGFGIEYLLGRTKKTERRAAFERCPLEHVLSYQRRISLIKHNFLMRGSTTPLGKILDFWDRTARPKSATRMHILPPTIPTMHDPTSKCTSYTSYCFTALKDRSTTARQDRALRKHEWREASIPRC